MVSLLELNISYNTQIPLKKNTIPGRPRWLYVDDLYNIKCTTNITTPLASEVPESQASLSDVD